MAPATATGAAAIAAAVAAAAVFRVARSEMLLYSISTSATLKSASFRLIYLVMGSVLTPKKPRQ
jgi:hypothetical protein